MQKLLFRFITAVLALASLHVSAETLSDYVAACKQQVGFTTLPNLDCLNNGVLFGPPNNPSDPESSVATNDYMGYARITDTVDLAFACRWVSPASAGLPAKAFSVEMTVHNRQTGNTCFFDANDDAPTGGGAKVTVLAAILSPTDPNAASYWKSPANVDSELRCVGCHSGGVYIASPRIAPFLGLFGLLNNGHDTMAGRYHAVSATINGVPGAFSQWDNIAHGINQTSSCSGACHAIADPNAANIVTTQTAFGFVLLPSIVNDINDVINVGAMPPWSDLGFNYRWINLDTPGDGVESENFADAMNATSTLVPRLFNSNPNCPQPNVPGFTETHAVGINSPMTTGQFRMIDGKLQVLANNNILRTFNVKEGLVCLNADQDPGVTCNDYEVSYLCGNGTPSQLTPTQFFNHTLNTNGGDDHEERSAINSQILAACGGAAPVGISLRTLGSFGGGTTSIIINGPSDRLARYSPYGLTCNNADQPDGQCANYVVRYSSCISPPAIVNRHLTSVWSGKQLTATSSTNNALTKGQPLTPSWNTQQWAIEPVTNTEYVRLRDTGTNTYLNVTSQAESATVITSTLNTTATSEQWIIEGVVNSNDFRLKNRWSGRYLTINDTSNFSAILSQSRNPGWTSQRWVIQ